MKNLFLVSFLFSQIVFAQSNLSAPAGNTSSGNFRKFDAIENEKLLQLCSKIPTEADLFKSECIKSATSNSYVKGVSDLLGRCTVVGCLINGARVSSNSKYTDAAIELIARMEHLGTFIDSLCSLKDKDISKKNVDRCLEKSNNFIYPTLICLSGLSLDAIRSCDDE